jgi:putative colanic acid biosynthesis acetyltransferase WcaF
VSADFGSCGSGIALYLSMPASINLERYDNSDFDRGAPRWKRRLWVVVRGFFFQNPWPRATRFKSALLRAFGAKIGRGLLIGSNVNILYPWRLTVGDHVWIGDDVGIQNLGQVTIESNVCVSRRCYLSTGSHDFRREDFKLKVAPILIQTGSWIALGSVITSGVTIGSGAVVSAGSVVLKDVPANCLVRGNPATVVYEIIRDAGSDKASVGVVRVRDKILSLSSDAIVGNADNVNCPDAVRSKRPVEIEELPNS